MAHFLVVGLNPAWQKVYQLKAFEKGTVNRVQKSMQLASGKGINCARVLKKLGHDVSVLQILGGKTGEDILTHLNELGISSYHAQINQPTRTCTTLITPGQDASEIIEPFEVGEDVTDTLVGRLKNKAAPYDSVLFCGSLPWGLPANTYANILHDLDCENIFLDGFQGFDRSFLNQVTAIKVNREEFISLQDELKDELPDKLQYILVTDGPREAVLYHPFEKNKLKVLHRYQLPPIEVINSIGAGDTVMAGFSGYPFSDKDIQQGCQEALAMGSASCLSVLPADYNSDDVQRIIREIKSY